MRQSAREVKSKARESVGERAKDEETEKDRHKKNYTLKRKHQINVFHIIFMILLSSKQGQNGMTSHFKKLFQFF